MASLRSRTSTWPDNRKRPHALRHFPLRHNLLGAAARICRLYPGNFSAMRHCRQHKSTAAIDAVGSWQVYRSDHASCGGPDRDKRAHKNGVLLHR